MTLGASGIFARPGFARADPGLAQLTDDLREADHRDDVVLADLTVVELAEEARELVCTADLGLVVFDLAGREVAESLDLDLVDDGVEDPLPLAVAGAAEDRDDHPLPVLRRLVSPPDGCGLPTR